MIHKPSQVIQDIAVRMATRIIPELNSEYAQADAGLLIGLLGTLAQDYESAALNLDLDIQAMKAIFKQGPQDSARETYIDSQAASLHLRDLTDFHDRGSNLLIELHAWAEENDADLNKAIWAYLRDTSGRHKFELPGMGHHFTPIEIGRERTRQANCKVQNNKHGRLRPFFLREHKGPESHR